MNGDFESGPSNWLTWFDGSTGYSGSFQLSNTIVFSGNQSGEILINTIGQDSAIHKINLKNVGFTLEQGRKYNVSCYIKSSVDNKPFDIQVFRDTAPYNMYSNNHFLTSKSWKRYSFSFISPLTTSDVRFNIKVGAHVADYYIDELVISPVNYASLLDPDYSIDWTRCGIPGGIPYYPNSENVINHGAVSDGVTDNKVAFQSALDAANYGSAVYIPAGDYKIFGPLYLPEGVVLRGECPTDTRLLFDMNGTNFSCIEILKFEYGNFTDVTAGLNKGSAVLTVSNISDFVLGGIVELQQENDPSIMYTDPMWIQNWSENAVGQLFRVSEINGNQITLDRTLNINYNPILNPKLRPLDMIENAGLENFYIERLDASDGNTIYFQNAARCWVKNIESNMTYRTHIMLNRSMDCEISGNYLHHSHDYGGGGHGYGVDALVHATSNLIENNIFEHLRHSMMVHMGATGNVFGYNYSHDSHWPNQHATPADISLHGHYPNMNLFEGNIVEEPIFADYWGPSGPGNTLFRNRVNDRDIRIYDHSHHSNIIGNEMTGGNTSIIVQDDVLNTWCHSNNVNGLIANTCSATIPASLYKTSQPDFQTGLAFPVFGSDVPLGSNSIDAQIRYDNNEILQCPAECHGFVSVQTGDVNDYENIITIESQAIIPSTESVKYHADKCLYFTNGFEVKKGATFLADIVACP